MGQVDLSEIPRDRRVFSAFGVAVAFDQIGPTVVRKGSKVSDVLLEMICLFFV